MDLQKVAQDAFTSVVEDMEAQRAKDSKGTLETQEKKYILITRERDCDADSNGDWQWRTITEIYPDLTFDEASQKIIDHYGDYTLMEGHEAILTPEQENQIDAGLQAKREAHNRAHQKLLKDQEEAEEKRRAEAAKRQREEELRTYEELKKKYGK